MSTVTVSIVVRDETGAITQATEIVPSVSALNAVLFDFNPSADVRASIVKALYAALIHRMQDIRIAAGATEPQVRNAAIAITKAEDAQVRAVKAYFAK